MTPLRTMMFLHAPYDFINLPGFWEELAENGIRDVVMGYLEVFQEDASGPQVFPTPTTRRPRVLAAYGGQTLRGRLVPGFAPDRDLYRGLDLEPEPLPEGMEQKAARLQEGIRAAADLGIRVYVFGAANGRPVSGGGAHPDRSQSQLDSGVTGGRLPLGGDWTFCDNNPAFRQYYAARLHDCYRHFPTIAGFVMDGPEFGYEIEPGHRSNIFEKFCQCRHCRDLAGSLGIDFDAIPPALHHLYRSLHQLNETNTRAFLDNNIGMSDLADLFLAEPALFDFLRLHAAGIESYTGFVYRALKAVDPRLELGVGSRAACFAPLTGHVHRRLRDLCDFQLPKIYLWANSVDGLKGTIKSYVDVLTTWSPSLAPATALALVERVFGISTPSGYPPERYGEPAPPAFFQQIVRADAAKQLWRSGDPNRISPWVALEHGGTWLTADELRQALAAMIEAGLTRYTYYVYQTIDDDVWRVIREFATGH